MSIAFATAKLVHQGSVVFSLAGFFVRGAAAIGGAAWPSGKVAKTLSQLVDTVLLLSALTLVWMLRLTPANAPWLMAKLVGLIAYVGLGILALRPGRPLRIRAAAWVAALCTVAWMVSVAITKSPLGFFSAEL
jgi:uncharacterized membrane protein SirB2